MMTTEITQSEPTGTRRISTFIDDEGRSWVEIEDLDADRFLEGSTEMMGGYPDTWKRR